MILDSIGLNFLLLLLQILVIIAEKEIKEPNDDYNLYWNEPVTLESIHTATYEVTKKIMDANVNPCDDFYEYACGNFAMNNTIPKGEKEINVFSILQNRVDYNLKQWLLEDDNTNDSKESGFSDTEVKLKNYIKSCINLDQIEKDGIKPAIEFLETLDGWPLSELENREEPFDWVNLTAHVNQFGHDIIFYNAGTPDIETRTKYIMGLFIGDPHFHDRRRYNITSEANKNHFYYLYNYLIKSVFKRFGANVNNLATTINDIIDFEVGLINVHLEYQDSVVNVTEITIEALHEIAPEIAWHTYYTTLYGKQIEVSEKILIPGEQYIKPMVEYLIKSKPETIAKYLFFMIAAKMDEMINVDLFKKEKRRIKKIKSDRFVQCLENTEKLMPNALTEFFVRRNLHLDSKKNIENMIAEIKNEFYDFINRTDWIDQPHKELAFNKLNLMTAKIGYTKEILDHETLREEYAYVEIRNNTFFANKIILTRHYFQKHNKLGKFLNYTDYDSVISTQLVNAVYDAYDQASMTFPAAILNPPFYHFYAQGWVKFGGLGATIGHEMVHAFDSDNMVLDSDANVHDFKSLKVIGKYYARSVCMSHQYSKYQFKESERNLDGSQTLDENISDNGGMTLALDAYRKWLTRNPELAENEKIPGLDLSPEQLFFLAYAQTHCETLSPEGILEYIEHEVHAPYKFRVIGSVSNSDSFSTAYNCPFAAPMNPVRKCKYE